MRQRSAAVLAGLLISAALANADSNPAPPKENREYVLLVFKNTETGQNKNYYVKLPLLWGFVILSGSDRAGYGIEDFKLLTGNPQP
jgi:hypothetical protein